MFAGACYCDAANDARQQKILKKIIVHVYLFFSKEQIRFHLDGRHFSLLDSVITGKSCLFFWGHLHFSGILLQISQHAFFDLL